MTPQREKLFNLPPLYFQEKDDAHDKVKVQQQQSLLLRTSDHRGDDDSVTSSSSSLLLTMLPSELLHHCLVSYGTYGTMCKLACIQQKWKTIVHDSIHSHDHRYQYQYAISMLHGIHGVQQQHHRSITVLQQITNITIDPITQIPICIVPYHQQQQKQRQRSSTSSSSSSKQYHLPLAIPSEYDNRNSVESSFTMDNHNGTCNGNNNSSDEGEEDKVVDYACLAMKKLADIYLKKDDIKDDDTTDTLMEEEVKNGTSPIVVSDEEIGLQWLLCCYYHYHNSFPNNTNNRDHTTITDRKMKQFLGDLAYEIATIYENGEYNVPVDIGCAIHYYYEAAYYYNHSTAMVELACYYELGCSNILEPNIEYAIYWYYHAATFGNPIAQYWIADAYENGIMIQQQQQHSSDRTIATGRNDSGTLSENTSAATAVSIPSTHTTTITNSDSTNTKNIPQACYWYYQAATYGNCADSAKSLLRLYDIARIIIPGIFKHTKSLPDINTNTRTANDDNDDTITGQPEILSEKGRILTNGLSGSRPAFK